MGAKVRLGRPAAGRSAAPAGLAVAPAGPAVRLAGLAVRLAVVSVGWVWWRRRLGVLPADFAAYWRRRARRPGEYRYVALGDSLAQGLTARRPGLGYVGWLADELAAGTGRTVQVLNLSVTGATVADLLATQLPVLLAIAEPPDLVTVCIGTNDVTDTPPEVFRARFRELCARLPAGTLVADLPTVRRGPHRVAAVALSAICRSVLAEFPGLVPVAVQRATAGMRVTELGLDLVHPGSRGHRRYTAAFVSAAQHP